MKRRGFTLAEVLVSIGVVGVVAATVVPGLVSNKNLEIFANGLSNAITAFESGMSSLMMREGVTDVFSTAAWKSIPGPNFTLNSESTQAVVNSFAGTVSQTFSIKPMGSAINFYPNSKIKSITNESVEVEDNEYLSEAQTFLSKNNVAYFITINNARRDPEAVDEMEALEAGRNLYARAGYVVIDVNSKEYPNTIGRDIFFFVLGSNGTLYPFGSNDVRGIEGNSNWRGDVLNQPVAAGRPGRPIGPNMMCENDTYSMGGIACTARLIENKFEIDY